MACMVVSRNCEPLYRSHKGILKGRYVGFGLQKNSGGPSGHSQGSGLRLSGICKGAPPMNGRKCKMVGILLMDEILHHLRSPKS